MILVETMKILDAEPAWTAVGSGYDDLEIRSCHASDLISDLLMFTGPSPLLLTGLTNSQVMRAAEMLDVVAICFVRNKHPDQATVRLAQDKGVPLFVTQLTMYESCGRLYKKNMPATTRREVTENCQTQK